MPNQYNVDQPRLQYLIRSIQSHNSDTCLIWPYSLTKRGYGQVRIFGRSNTAHRVAFRLTYGRWPKPCGCHTCDVTACFNPRHIFEGTQRDNILDSSRKGRMHNGELTPNAKLTAELVRQIRSEYVFNDRARSLAALGLKFGVGPGQISKIIRREAWKHIV